MYVYMYIYIYIIIVIIIIIIVIVIIIIIIIIVICDACGACRIGDVRDPSASEGSGGGFCGQLPCRYLSLYI